MGKPSKINETSEMTLVDHLAELRKRLIVVVVVNLGVAMVLFQFSELMMSYLLNLNPGVQLIYIEPSELFMVYIQIALIGALVLCSPVTIYEICAFVSKGLYQRERRYLVLSLVAGLFFFAGGVYFCYIVVLPTTLGFFMRLTIDAVKPMLSVQSFASFVNMMLFSFGLVFEMPVICFALAKLGILKGQFLKEKQGVLIVIIFIFAAIITPPDVVSQVMLGIPMVLLLQMSTAICVWVDRQNQKKQERNH